MRRDDLDHGLSDDGAAMPQLEEDSLQFLWAVSYCDMLMVLMCFFILFFQVTDTPKSALNRVLLSLKGETPTQTAIPQAVSGGISLNPDKKIAQASAPLNFEALVKALSGADLKVVASPTEKSVTIDFDPDLYKPGQYAFPTAAMPHLKSVLRVIQPYETRLQLTFIGHADPTPITKLNRKIIDSNLVLSDLRAARAVEVALTNGFNPLRVVAQGDGEYLRGTRSLSIRLSELKP